MPILPTHHSNAQHDNPPDSSFSSQQRDMDAERRARGPLSYHLAKPKKVPMSLAIKNHFVAMIGEFVGTSLFMIFALGGTNVANIPTTSVTGATTEGQSGTTAAAVNTSSLLYISLAFGFSLAVNAWIFFRISGGLFNPAVSLGMALVGALTPLRAALLTVSQILGGIVGAAIIQAVTPGTLNVRTQLGGGINVAQGLFLEMFLTSLLMLTILLLAAEKHKATFLAPIGIGLALFIAEMVGVYYTGGSLNPARSFGPDVVLTTFSSYHWIYWLGPAMGATLAAGFYKFMKYLEYETVLGPEPDGEKPVPPHGAVVPGGASGDVLDHGDEKKGHMMRAMGPGVGDLLTHGEPAAVYDLPQGPKAYDERIDNMTFMLQRLLEERRMGSPTVQGDAALPSRGKDHRDSMVTVVSDNGLGSGYKKTSLDATLEEGPEGRAAYAPAGKTAPVAGSPPGRPGGEPLGRQL